MSDPAEDLYDLRTDWELPDALDKKTPVRFSGYLSCSTAVASSSVLIA